MAIVSLNPKSKAAGIFSLDRFYGLFAHRAYSVIIFAALFCTLAVKFFHARRLGLVDEYFSWIPADVAVLLGIDVVLTILCFRWPHRFCIRTAAVIAAVVCTWSVMNAGWLLRTGTQILPTVLLPLIRNPLNALSIIGVNLAKMPVAAVVLLVPSAVALGFFFYSLAKAFRPEYNRKHLLVKILLSFFVISAAISFRGAINRRGTERIVSELLSYNCQLKAVTYFVLPRPGHLARSDLAGAKRTIPSLDQVEIAPPTKSLRQNHNVILVVLEGVQYSYTSLADRKNNLTPYLASLAGQGVEFTNTRTTLTHTTKVLFSLLTGRFPSASQDIVEAVPVERLYASITAILKKNLNFRTAFFQSAKGNFEARPGLVHNLGFDKFLARDDLNDPNAHLGYLACDEFSMLKPITEWLQTGDSPFFLTVLCSVTHDPYEVPEWFAEPAKAPIERYRQAIFYTDKFLAALDEELERLNLADKTVFCVIGDHGEAFGEHGLLGHERIAFDEVLRVPFCLRMPGSVRPKTIVSDAVSSVDLAPTLLTLLGFETTKAGFDGVDALADIPDGRKVYFSGWLQESPAGFVKANNKFVYNPTNKKCFAYDLAADPTELFRIALTTKQQQEIADDIIGWRKDTILKIDQQRTGKKMLFDSWLCRWSNRICSAKYRR
jgi:phosphoglycerol transferase MdoB-like AlkP superfamily enzyme